MAKKVGRKASATKKVLSKKAPPKKVATKSAAPQKAPAKKLAAKKAAAKKAPAKKVASKKSPTTRAKRWTIASLKGLAAATPKDLALVTDADMRGRLHTVRVHRGELVLEGDLDGAGGACS